MMKLEKNKPYLILCNHTSNADPCFVQLAFTRSIHFIAHYELMASKMGRLVDHMFGIIPTMKGKVDLHGVRESMRIAKDNGVIGLFPSGDCTFSGVESPIDKSIVKYVRLIGADTILYRTFGLYGVDPRFSHKRRKGKASGSVVRILTKEEIDKLSDDELYKIIMDAINVNHYEELKEELYRSNKKAEYLEQTLFVCPDCHNISSLQSNGNIIKCDNCGYKIEYQENLHLKLLSGKNGFDTILDWINFEKKELKKLGGDVKFSDDLKKIKVESKNRFDNFKGGHLELLNNKIVLSYGNKIIEFDIMKDKMILHGKKRLVIYHEDDVYNLIGGNRFCGIKYIYYQESKVSES